MLVGDGDERGVDILLNTKQGVGLVRRPVQPKFQISGNFFCSIQPMMLLANCKSGLATGEMG